MLSLIPHCMTEILSAKYDEFLSTQLSLPSFFGRFEWKIENKKYTIKRRPCRRLSLIFFFDLTRAFQDKIKQRERSVLEKWGKDAHACPANEFSPSCEEARNSVAYKPCVCTTVKIPCGAKFCLFYCRGHWKRSQQRQRSAGISRPVSRILSVNASRTTAHANGQTERETRLCTLT